MPKVSVITPVFNGERFVAGFFAMLLAQTFDDFELVIVDDKSTDGSADRIRTFAGDPRVILVSLPENGGAARARNAGLSRARGEYVCFLDVDDAWHPDKLKVQLAFMTSSGEALSYMDYARVDASGRVLSEVRPPDVVDYDSMLKSNRIGNLTAMVRKDAITDLEFVTAGHEDYVFWLQVLRRIACARKVPSRSLLCSYMVHGGSLSSNKLRAAGWQWHIYRSVLGLGRVSAAWYMAHYVARSLAKRL